MTAASDTFARRLRVMELAPTHSRYEMAEMLGVGYHTIRSDLAATGAKCRDTRGEIMTHKIDPKRLDQMRAWAEEGISQSTMATFLGISRERVRQICKKRGITTLPGHADYDLREKVVAAIEGGAHVAEAARMAGCSQPGASHILKRLGIKPPKKHGLTDDIRDCIADGMSLAATARKLQRTPQVIWNTANSNGVRFIVKERTGRKPRQVCHQQRSHAAGPPPGLNHRAGAVPRRSPATLFKMEMKNGWKQSW